MFIYSKNLFKFNLFTLSLLTELQAHDEKLNSTPSSTQESIRNMRLLEAPAKPILNDIFNLQEKSKVTGEIRSIYSGYNYEKEKSTSDLALGGFVKYEIFPSDTLNMAIALRTSKDVIHDNGELSSNARDYTALTQAYLSYSLEDLKIRLGRQILNTPLANADDNRMFPNTFKAYQATYAVNNLSFSAGHIRSWQGFSAGLGDSWIDTGTHGTNFINTSYDGSLVDMNLWFYNIHAKARELLANNSFYVDVKRHFHLSPNSKLAIATQYLKQQTLKQSGIASEIYGLQSTLDIHDFGFYIAYNKALKQNNKRSFEGFGGGTLFTNMDSMILDVITQDRASQSWASGLGYSKNNFDFLYAYAEFKGDSNSQNIKEFISEHNVALKYNYHKQTTLGLVYANLHNKKRTLSNNGTWDNFRVLISYGF